MASILPVALFIDLEENMSKTGVLYYQSVRGKYCNKDCVQCL